MLRVGAREVAVGGDGAMSRGEADVAAHGLAVDPDPGNVYEMLSHDTYPQILQYFRHLHKSRGAPSRRLPPLLVRSHPMSTAPYVLGTIAAVGIVKALFRPRRAVVKEGAVASCPGRNRFGACDPSLIISTPVDTPVYATAGGQVVAVGPHFVHISTRSETVILAYDGLRPDVVEGQNVGRGQEIGLSNGHVAFSVSGFEPGGRLVKIDPASWLASRGQRIAHKYTGPGTEWCEQGRHIDVPKDAGSACALYEPDKGAFALLPVTVSIER